MTTGTLERPITGQGELGESLELDFPLHDRQWEAWQALEQPEIDELLFGGAKGGGKTHLGCLWSYYQCLRIIKEFGLRPRKNPLAVGWMGRKQGTDFRTTTLEIFKRVIPPDAYTIRVVDHEIIVAGTVKMFYGGLDREEDISKFNSAELAFFFLDQAEETSPDDVRDLRASLRLKINGRDPGRTALYTANPAQCWLREEFILAPQPGQRFIKSLWSDNPSLPEDYVHRMEYAYRHRPELLAAYRDGVWDAFEGEAQVIRQAWVAEAHKRRLWPTKSIGLIACDPAEFGDDETVIYRLHDTEIVEHEIYGQKSPMHTANRLFVMSRDNGRLPVAIDAIGIGSPIASRLVEMGVDVIAIRGSEKAGNVEKYANLRAECWMLAGDMFGDGEVSLSQHSDRILDGQLCSPTYHLPNGRYLIEAKEEIKKTLHRSPDRADAYVIGLAALRVLRKQGYGGRGVKVFSGKDAPGREPEQFSVAWFDAQEKAAKAAKKWWE